MSEHIACKAIEFPGGAFFKCPVCELSIEHDVEQADDGSYEPVNGGYTQCEECDAYVRLPKFTVTLA